MPYGSRPKYQPLTDYLAAQPAAVETVTLPLTEVEALLGAPLPASARRAAWWLSSRGVHLQQWRGAGWRVARCELRTPAPSVTFERLPPR